MKKILLVLMLLLVAGCGNNSNETSGSGNKEEETIVSPRIEVLGIDLASATEIGYTTEISQSLPTLSDPKVGDTNILFENDNYQIVDRISEIEAASMTNKIERSIIEKKTQNETKIIEYTIVLDSMLYSTNDLIAGLEDSFYFTLQINGETDAKSIKFVSYVWDVSTSELSEFKTNTLITYGYGNTVWYRQVPENTKDYYSALKKLEAYNTITGKSVSYGEIENENSTQYSDVVVFKVLAQEPTIINKESVFKLGIDANYQAEVVGNQLVFYLDAEPEVFYLYDLSLKTLNKVTVKEVKDSGIRSTLIVIDDKIYYSKDGEGQYYIVTPNN